MTVSDLVLQMDVMVSFNTFNILWLVAYTQEYDDDGDGIDVGICRTKNRITWVVATVKYLLLLTAEYSLLLVSTHHFRYCMYVVDYTITAILSCIS